MEKKITFPDKFADAEWLTNDKVKKEKQIVFEEETLLHEKECYKQTLINEKDYDDDEENLNKKMQ